MGYPGSTGLEAIDYVVTDRYADPADPTRGFLFDGRISEDFKLDTGTWVSTGPLRLRALAHFAPFVSDAVVSGADRRQLALLAFPDVTKCRAIATDVPATAPLSELLASPLLRAALGNALEGFADSSTGSATRIERLVLLEEPPQLDAGEITDKGSLNVRTILGRRASIVDDAHADEPPPHVIAARGRVARR